MSQTFMQVLYYSVSFLLFFFFTWKLSRSHNHQLFTENYPGSLPNRWMFLQLAGVLIFGLVIAVRNSVPLNEIIFSTEKLSLMKAAAFFTCVFFVLFLANRETKKSNIHLIKSEINPLYTKFQFICVYFLVRSLFIIVYETWFRGYLLYDATQVWGTAAAVLMNVFLYFLIHIFNDRKILFGTVLFGLLLCLFTIWFKSALPAILLHLVLTLSAEGRMLIKIHQQLKSIT